MTAIPNVSTTPDGITIEPRNRKFELQRALATYWFDNDPFLTAVFNAMSMSFPSGEKGFIDSIRHYDCLLYTSPSPRDKRQSRMPSSA